MKVCEALRALRYELGNPINVNSLNDVSVSREHLFVVLEAISEAQANMEELRDHLLRLIEALDERLVTCRGR